MNLVRDVGIWKIGAHIAFKFYSIASETFSTGSTFFISGLALIDWLLCALGFPWPGVEAVQLEQDLFHQHPVGGDDISQQTEECETHTDEGTDGGKDERLDVAKLGREQVIVEKSRYECEPDQKKRQGERQEKPQRLIQDEDPHQRSDGARDVNGNVRDQSGRPNTRVGCYRYAHDPQSASTRLNECLKGVGIAREYQYAHRRVAAIGTKAT